MATPAKTGFYTHDFAEPKEFSVLKENPDKTVDIGTGDTVAVRSCPVSAEPKHGHFTFGKLPKKKTEETATPTDK